MGPSPGEDVTLNVVDQEDAANEVTQLHSEFASIIVFTKHQSFCLGRIIFFCCIYPQHLKVRENFVWH